MNFEFSEEQETVRELARDILEKEASAERIKQASASASGLDEELWAKLAEANLIGLAIPEAYGGMGMGFLELCCLLEQVGRKLSPIPVLETLVLGALPIAEFGTPEQQASWLPKVASGKTLLSAALVDAGSADALAPATVARAEGAGFVLDGVKRFVPVADRAERILVPANTDAGSAVFLVDPQAPGVTLETSRISTGARIADVTLSGVRVAPEDRLGGAEARGDEVLSWLVERALVGIAALQMGVSDEALAITAGYVTERQQFGVPIGSFQAVQHRAADGFIDLEALRWCTWRAAWKLAEGQPAARDAAIAKYWASEAGARIANGTVHLHGGIGSDVDYPIQRYFLWARALEYNLGSAAPQLAWLGRDLAQHGPLEDRS